MAETFDVHVVGIDLLVNMMSFALERAIGLNCSVEFEVADCTTNTYPDNSFDVIYSSATIFHIQVSNIHSWRFISLLRVIIICLFFLSRTSQLCLRHSSSGLNQAEEFSSLTIARVMKLRLHYSQRSSNKEDMISMMFKPMDRFVLIIKLYYYFLFLRVLWIIKLSFL